MIYSENGLRLTREFEGCSLVSYPDSGGVWTIGYGHTAGVHQGMSCTQDEANQWLFNDTMNAQNDVNTLVKVPLTQNQFDALVDFDFNIGAPQFHSSTLLRLLNQGNYVAAANEFPKWNLDNGVVEPGLVRRRAAVKALFLS